MKYLIPLLLSIPFAANAETYFCEVTKCTAVQPNGHQIAQGNCDLYTTPVVVELSGEESAKISIGIKTDVYGSFKVEGKYLASANGSGINVWSTGVGSGVKVFLPTANPGYMQIDGFSNFISFSLFELSCQSLPENPTWTLPPRVGP